MAGNVQVGAKPLKRVYIFHRMVLIAQHLTAGRLQSYAVVWVMKLHPFSHVSMVSGCCWGRVLCGCADGTSEFSVLFYSQV